jgi:small subunit ribosomal protein S18
MATLQQSASGKDGDIRYLTPLNIETNKQKSIVVSKNIKYIDYKDGDFLLKLNEQGKFFLVV